MKYIIQNAYTGYGAEPKEFTSLKEMNDELNDRIREGEILTVKARLDKGESFNDREE